MLATHPPTEEQVAELYAATANRTWAKAFLLSYAQIEDQQKCDRPLRRLLREYPDKYKETVFPSGDKRYTLITKENKIVLPKTLQEEGIKWYHGVLMHPGKTRTELTMGQHFTWRGMRHTVQFVCRRCASCHLNKTKKPESWTSSRKRSQTNGPLGTCLCRPDRSLHDW